MVLILDGNSEVVAYIRLLFDLFKAFDQFESSHSRISFIRKDLFCSMRAQHILSYHIIL